VFCLIRFPIRIIYSATYKFSFSVNQKKLLAFCGYEDLAALAYVENVSPHQENLEIKQEEEFPYIPLEYCQGQWNIHPEMI